MKKILSVIFCAIALSSSTPVAAKEMPLDKVVASVNGEVITSSELARQKKLLLSQLPKDAQLPPESTLIKQVLDNLVLNKIKVQRAEQYGIEVDAVTIDTAIDELLTHKGMNRSELKAKLQSDGISYEEYRENVRKELLFNKMQQQELAARISVSEQEVDQFINSPQGQLSQGTTFHLAHYLVKTPELATKQQVQEAKETAKAISKKLTGLNSSQSINLNVDTNKVRITDIGERQINQIPALFAHSVVNLNAGDTTDPIQNSDGIHFVKILSKKTNGKQNDTQYKAKHILIETGESRSSDEAKQLLTKLYNQIKSGKVSFEEQAKKYSQEGATSSKGGQIDWVTKENTVPEFYKALSLKNKPGLVKPFKSDLGWHLVKIEDKRDASTSEKVARKNALNILREQKYMELVQNWSLQLLDQAEIKKYL